MFATLGSLAHATLACATEVATALRDTRRYALPSRSLSVKSLVTCLARPRGRVFVPNCPKAETAPLQGKGCHAATGARIVPWRQPGDWLIIFRSPPPRFSAPSPTCGLVLEAPCGGGAGLGRDRPRSDPAARWRPLVLGAGPAGSDGGRWPVMRGSLATGPGYRRWDSDGGLRLEARSLGRWTRWPE